MDLQTRVYSGQGEVEARLARLELGRKFLVDAVHFGYTYAAECTRHDPANLAGLLIWGKTTRKLRDQLIPLGWDIENRQNYPLTVHPSKQWAIGVVPGDERTGVADRTPSTRSERGPATRQVVNTNQMSFAALSPYFTDLDAELIRQTWLLMHYRCGESDEIRIELSLPAEMTSGGFVIQWQERIILSDGIQSIFTRSVQDSESRYADEIDIPVRKKA